MRSVLFAIVMVMVATMSHGIEIEGRILKKYCDSANKNAEEIGVCKGILTAAVSSFTSWPYCEIEIEGGMKILAPFCDGECDAPVTINSPKELNIIQVRQIVIKYLSDHPENLNYPSFWIARQTLHEAFGIKKVGIGLP